MDIIFPSVLVARNIFLCMSSLIIILADFHVKIDISAYLQKDNNIDMFKQSEKDFKKKPIKNHTFSYSLCQTVQSTSPLLALFYYFWFVLLKGYGIIFLDYVETVSLALLLLCFELLFSSCLHPQASLSHVEDWPVIRGAAVMFDLHARCSTRHPWCRERMSNKASSFPFAFLSSSWSLFFWSVDCIYSIFFSLMTGIPAPPRPAPTHTPSFIA